jgi:hypothetical protein
MASSTIDKITLIIIIQRTKFCEFHNSSVLTTDSANAVREISMVLKPMCNIFPVLFCQFKSFRWIQICAQTSFTVSLIVEGPIL